MPKYSKEIEKEHMARIRALLVQDPKLSIIKIKDILSKHPTVPLNLDRMYISRLYKKIRNERATRYNYYTVHAILGKFEDEIEEMKLRLWSMLSDPNIKPHEKISAIKELRQSTDTLIERMFDAGIFERQLGRIREEQLTPEIENKLGKLEEALKNDRDSNEYSANDTENKTG